MIDLQRKPRMGLLLLAPERFVTLGEGTARGSYAERKRADAEEKVAACAGFAEVTFSGIVYNTSDVCRAIDAFTLAKVDCVLAVYLSWAEDYAWIRFLRDMPPVPVLFAHVMRDGIELSDTHDDDEFTEYLCCGGLVGALEASGDNVNYRRPMLDTALGTWSEVLRRVGDFARAARARALLRESRVGLLACYNEAMWSTYVHPYDVFRKVGPELTFLSVAELEDEVNRVTEADAREAMRRIARRYLVLPGVEEESFFASVRASMAMERLAARREIDLLVLNDIDRALFERIGLRPGFYPTDEDVRTVVVPEGDLGGGIATFTLKLLTGERVNFIEPFHIDLPNENFAAGHAGPNDYTDPAGSTKISRDVRFARSSYRYAGAPFAWHVFAQGRKTMLHCSQHDGRFRFVTTQLECLPTEHFLATYSHALFSPVGQTCGELFKKLIDIGVTQHYGIAPGDCSAGVRDLARMLDFDLFEI